MEADYQVCPFNTTNMRVILLTCSLLILSSCNIRGNFGGLFSYYKKTNKTAPNLIYKTNEIIDFCDINKDTNAKVMMINDVQLQQCLLSKEKSLIYIWSPNCSGNYCYSLNAIQERCNLKNIELFIVAEYYDYAKMIEPYNLAHPILGIDTKYYKTNLTNKYMSQFYSGLISQETVTGKFLRFENGEFREAFNLIDSI